MENLHNMKDQLTEKYQKHRMLIILILLAAAAVLPHLLNNNYYIGIATKILMYMLIASAVNVINGYSGQFAIGHAGFLCVGAYTAAICMTKGGMNFFLALPVAGIMTSIFGLLVSLPISKLSGIYLGFVTLGFSEIVRIICLNWTSVTGGPMGIKAIYPSDLYGILHNENFKITNGKSLDLDSGKWSSGGIDRYQYRTV